MGTTIAKKCDLERLGSKELFSRNSCHEAGESFENIQEPEIAYK